jgi:hypothetical protein
MAELQAEFVKRGYWVNEDHGSVMGQTITTDSQTGAIIIALLALLTSLGMSHLWHLITYAWHQARATGHARDGLYRQQQVLLRTLPTPSALFADCFKIWYAWRKSTKGAWRRASAPAAVALFFSFATIATSILSSYVAESIDVEVLVNSPHCAMLNISQGQGTYMRALEPLITEYASQCYHNKSLPQICNIFSRPNVALSTETVDCPFDPSICLSSGVAIDSGHVDIAKAFGLNIRGDNGLLYKKRSVCSMLSLEGRTAIMNISDIDPNLLSRRPIPGEQFSVYKFGDPNGSGTTFGISLLSQYFSQSLGYAYVQVYNG